MPSEFYRQVFDWRHRDKFPGLFFRDKLLLLDKYLRIIKPSKIVLNPKLLPVMIFI